MHYGPESQKSEGMLAVEITKNDRQQVDWAPFVVKDLVKLILRLFILLAMQGVIHGTDSIVGFALSCGIPLVAGPSSIVVMLHVVVIVAAREGLRSCSS